MKTVQRTGPVAAYVATIWFLLFPIAALAQEASKLALSIAEGTAAVEPVIDWAQVVRDLDSDDYQSRELASRRLAKSGSAEVVPLLVAAIGTGSPEVVWRGTKALEQIAIAGDESAAPLVKQAIEQLEKLNRPELAHVISGLQEKQLWFQHERSTKRLQKWGAKVATQIVQGDDASSLELLAMEGMADVEFFPAGIELAGGLIVPAMAEDLADDIDIEWEVEPQLMTLEDQLAQYEPIQVTFLDRFLERIPTALDVPGAIAGWEDVTAEELAELDAMPADFFEGEPVEVAGFEGPLEEAIARRAIALTELERLEGIEEGFEIREDAEMPAEDGDMAMIEEDVDLDAFEIEFVEGDEVIADFDFAPGAIWIGSGMEEEIAETAIYSTATIDRNWTGGDEGIEELAQLQGTTVLTLQNAPLTDAALKHLTKIEELASLQIVGGKFSPQALLDFHRSQPQIAVSARSNAWMGVNASGTPCQVERVVEASAAAKAGIQEGDVIVSVDGLAIEEFTELSLVLCSRDANDTVRLEIRRGNKTIFVPVTLQPRP